MAAIIFDADMKASVLAKNRGEIPGGEPWPFAAQQSERPRPTLSIDLSPIARKLLYVIDKDAS